MNRKMHLARADQQLPRTGAFGPTALARLRAITTEQQRLQSEANALLGVVLEAVGYDLVGTSVAARYDVTGEKNAWWVDRVEPVAGAPNGAPQSVAPNGVLEPATGAT